MARARGLVRRWFSSEHPVLAAFNMVLSVVVLALTLTMTLIGMRIAQHFGLVVTLNEAANALAPYAGATLLVLGALRLLQTIMSGERRLVRMLGFVEATALLVGGTWAEAVAWYAGSIPTLLKPALEFAGGAVTTELAFFSLVVVPFFKPALAAAFGLLFTAKHLKTAVQAEGQRSKWYAGMIGLVASAATLLIGIDISHRHFVGMPQVHDVSVEQRIDRWAQQFASPFADGVACRISDTFGPRINPFYGLKPKAPAGGAHASGAAPVAATPPSAAQAAAVTTTPATPTPAPPARIEPRIENHPGVDLAVRAGTTVHSLANGTVIFTGTDGGFGNMAVLRVANADKTTTTFLLGHMAQLLVQPGQTIVKGDAIGIVGSTGRSTGPHLHLQVCPAGHVTGRGGFACGTPENPYENWLALSAIARLSCSNGPVGSLLLRLP
jgi:hypothetical protein